MDTTDIFFGYHDYDLDGFMTGYLFSHTSVCFDNNIQGFNYNGKNLLGKQLWSEEDILKQSVKPKYIVFGDYCPSLGFLKKIVDDNNNGRGEVKKVIIYDHHKNSYDKVVNEFDSKNFEANPDTSKWDLDSKDIYIYYKYSTRNSGCKMVYDELINQNSALARLIDGCPLICQETLIKALVEDISEYDTWKFTENRQQETERIEFLKIIYYLQNYKDLKQFTDLLENKRKYPDVYSIDMIIDDMRFAGNELITNQISQNLRGIETGKSLTLGRFHFLLLSEGHPNYFIENQIKEVFEKETSKGGISYNGYITYDIDFQTEKVTLHFRGFKNSDVDIPTLMQCYFGNGGGHKKAGSCQISLLEFTKILNNDWN